MNFLTFQFSKNNYIQKNFCINCWHGKYVNNETYWEEMIDLFFQFNNRNSAINQKKIFLIKNDLKGRINYERVKKIQKSDGASNLIFFFFFWDLYCSERSKPSLKYLEETISELGCRNLQEQSPYPSAIDFWKMEFEMDELDI